MAASLETNKILAAILTAGIFASGAGVMSRILYHPTAPEEPAYVIEVVEGEGGGGGEGGGEETAVALLASADPGAGESGAKKCAACHTFDDGGENKIGPNLYGVVGREIGGVAGFGYSDAMAGHGGVWDYEALDQFLANPKGYVAGTKMAFAGIRGAQDRADVIAYLASVTPDAPAFPEGGGEAEGGEEDAASADEGGGEQAEGEEQAAADQPAEGADEAAAEDEAEAADDAAAGVADTAETAADQAGEAAGDVAEGAEEMASDTAEAVEGAASETADAAGEAAADAGEAASEAAEAAAEQSEDAAAAVSDAAEDAGDAAVEATEEAGDAAKQAAGTAAGAAGATVAAVSDAAGDAAEEGGDAAGGLVAMIADADPAAGEKVARKCKACHVFEEGGKNRLGPALWDVVNRDIGSHEGFSYSGALSEMEGEWTYEKLDEFLAAPKEWAPGTKMVFAGIKDDADRADLIAYLRTLAAEPAPLGNGG